MMRRDGIDYDAAKNRLQAFLREIPLHLHKLDRAALEAQAAVTGRVFRPGSPSIEQRCVNYLRHQASAYDEIVRKLNTAIEGIAWADLRQKKLPHANRASFGRTRGHPSATTRQVNRPCSRWPAVSAWSGRRVAV
jgi:hypothetical protein